MPCLFFRDVVKCCDACDCSALLSFTRYLCFHEVLLCILRWFWWRQLGNHWRTWTAWRVSTAKNLSAFALVNRKRLGLSIQAQTWIQVSQPLWHQLGRSVLFKLSTLDISFLHLSATEMRHGVKCASSRTHDLKLKTWQSRAKEFVELDFRTSWHPFPIPHIFVWGSCFLLCAPVRPRPPSTRLHGPLFVIHNFVTHNFVTHNSFTHLSFTQHCQRMSNTTLSQATLPHITLSHTYNFVTHTQNSFTDTHTYNFVTHTHTTLPHAPLSHTHTQFCHTHNPLTHLSFTHNFVTQKQLFTPSMVLLGGRRGTYGTGLALVARLVAAVTPPAIFCVWQAWHLVTWTFTLCGRLLHPLKHSFTYIPHPFHARIFHAQLYHTQLLHTSPFTFPLFPSQLHLSFATYWQKLTCGVIRSFNLCLFKSPMIWKELRSFPEEWWKYRDAQLMDYDPKRTKREIYAEMKQADLKLPQTGKKYFSMGKLIQTV